MDIKEMESIIEQKDKELRKLSHELMNSKARCSLLKNEADKQTDIADKCLLALRGCKTGQDAGIQPDEHESGNDGGADRIYVFERATHV